MNNDKEIQFVYETWRVKMGRPRKYRPLGPTEHTVTKRLFYHQLVKQPIMDGDPTDISLSEIINALRDRRPIDSSAFEDFPYSKKIEDLPDFPNAFRFNMKSCFFDFLHVDDDECYAVYGKKDYPENAKVVTSDNKVYDKFKIEYFTSIYINSVDNIIVSINGSKVPPIGPVFERLCSCGNSNYIYNVSCILNKNAVDKLERTQEVKLLRVKFAGPNIDILRKSRSHSKINDVDLRYLTSNKFLLTEATLIFRPNVRATEKKRFAEVRSNVVSFFKGANSIDCSSDLYDDNNKTSSSSTVITDMTAKFLDEDLKIATIKYAENLYGKSTHITYFDEISPLDIYTALKRSYNENRTDVLSNTIRK